jgi:hypothetical protein
MPQEPVAVTGLWTRTRIDTTSDGRKDTIEVLLEIDGKWMLVQSHPLHMPIDQMISHITEPLGIQKSKPDPLGD